MSYLTFDEFKEYSKKELTEDQFEEYAAKAAIVLNNVTQHYYEYNELEHDPVDMRKNNFTRAFVAQIEFFYTHKTTDFNEIASIPQSYSVGRTSVTNSDSRSNEDSNNYTSIVADDVYLYLEGTGLLYRGGAL